MNNIIDVIILSYAKDNAIIEMNNNCINSIINSTNNYKFNIILVETEPSREFTYAQEGVTVIQPRIKFGYNKFLNIGLDCCKNEWVLITNNDTIYEKGFIEAFIHANKRNNKVLSMSPIDNHWTNQKLFNRLVPVHYGYRLKYEIVGWSIFLHRSVIDIIGKFDETFSFWYQDDDYVKNLVKYKIAHALVIGSRVHHLLSKSNHLVDNFNQMAKDGDSYFKYKWNNMEMFEFIIPAYDRPALLKCMLASLIAQSSTNWKARVIIDNPSKSVIDDIVTSFSDRRIIKTNMDKRYNDWGHTPREFGKSTSNAQYVIMTGDDNYYTPNMVKELEIAAKNKPGMIYWDMIHSHYNYSYFKCSPSINHIDMGAFATRTDLAKQIILNKTFAADGEFIEEFKRRFPDEKIVKIEQVLFVHN